MTASSSRLRILLSRETLTALVAVLVLAAVCVMLGLWQFGRYEARRDGAAVVQENYDAAPVALDQVLPSTQQPLPAAAEWTPVTMHGSYCTEPECVIFVRNRQLGGQVGYWQLAPFRADDGTTLLVVRGWVPEGADSSAPADTAAVPSGELTLTIRMRPAEPVLDRVPPPGQAHSVNPPQISGLIGLEDTDLVTQAFGELVAEEPAAERPAALPAPDTSLGPHLSYSFQWWIFALFFPAALIYRTRRQFQDLAAEEEAEEQAGEQEARDVRETPAAASAGDYDRGSTTGSAATENLDADPRTAADPSAGNDPSAGTDPPAEVAARAGLRSSAASAPDQNQNQNQNSDQNRARKRRTPEHRPRRAVHARSRGQDEEEEDALIDQQKP